jgi:hypothetical protein
VAGESAGAERFFAYMLHGRPVGLMLISDRNAFRLCIEYLVTHPGSVGGGGILIEHAVNLSEQAGYKGRVELESLTIASTAAYTALGFAKVAGSHMRALDPSECQEKWVKVGEQWRLKKYRDRKGFAFVLET